MELVLVKLDLAKGFDLDRPVTLGSTSQVQANIREALSPSRTVHFNGRGEGILTSGDCRINFSVAAGDDVTEIGIEVSGPRVEAFRLLSTLCTHTGWTLFDRATGRFPDVRHDAAPARRREATTPMFMWWRTLPAWVRIAVGLLIGWVIFYATIAQWVASWRY